MQWIARHPHFPFNRIARLSDMVPVPLQVKAQIEMDFQIHDLAWRWLLPRSNGACLLRSPAPPFPKRKLAGETDAVPVRERLPKSMPWATRIAPCDRGFLG